MKLFLFFIIIISFNSYSCEQEKIKDLTDFCGKLSEQCENIKTCATIRDTCLDDISTSEGCFEANICVNSIVKRNHCSYSFNPEKADKNCSPKSEETCPGRWIEIDMLWSVRVSLDADYKCNAVKTRYQKYEKLCKRGLEAYEKQACSFEVKKVDTCEDFKNFDKKIGEYDIGVSALEVEREVSGLNQKKSYHEKLVIEIGNELSK